MLKRYLVFEIDVVDKASEDKLKEVEHLCSLRGFMTSTIVRPLCDEEGKFLFKKNTRKFIKYEYNKDLKSVEHPDALLSKYIQYIAMNHKLFCLVNEQDGLQMENFGKLLTEVSFL